MLDDQLRQDLLWLAEEMNRSMSQVARELLAEKIQEEKKKVKKSSKISAVASLREMAEAAKRFETKGPRDLARNHDKYLY